MYNIQDIQEFPKHAESLQVDLPASSAMMLSFGTEGFEHPVAPQRVGAALPLCFYISSSRLPLEEYHFRPPHNVRCFSASAPSVDDSRDKQSHLLTQPKTKITKLLYPLLALSSFFSFHSNTRSSTTSFLLLSNLFFSSRTKSIK